MSTISSPTTAPNHCDYGSIITQLLKTCRGMQPAYEAQLYPVKTVMDVLSRKTVAVSGNRQTGKTRAVAQLQKDEHAQGRVAVVICHDTNMRKDYLDRVGNEFAPLVFTRSAVLALINRLSNETGEKLPARTILQIEVDENVEDVKAALLQLMDEYKAKQIEIKERNLPPMHPLRHVDMVIVDDYMASGTPFNQIARFGRLGGRLPEFVLIG